jgi:enoyl-CoA hydratase/carnithine racemase
VTVGIELERRDHVGVITIDRPAVRNAIDYRTANEIAEAVDEFEEDSEIRAIVITGRGGIFCAGMDLKALSATGQRPITETRGAFGIVAKPPAKPLIAAVEGAALGGGLEIALTADIMVVAHSAVLGLPEVKRGLVAAAGGVIRLPNRIPRALAMEMILTGEPISAERGRQIGLVNRVVADGEACTVALQIAETVAGNAPMAVRAAKAVARESANWADEDAFGLQRRYIAPVRDSEDAKEGALAFVQKRAPLWRDR